MKENEQTYELLAHQIEHEKSLSKLYKAYMDKFPETEVWGSLEKEEKKHVAWIQQLITKVCDGTIYFNDRIQCCEEMKKSIKLIKEETAKAINKGVDQLHAFKASIEIEGSMIEREFFQSLESDAPFVEEVLDKIKADTERHKQSLEEAKNEFLISIE